MAMPIPMPDVVAAYKHELESQRHPAPTKATAQHFQISDRQVRKLVEEFRITTQRAQRAAAAVAAPVEERQPPESAADAALVEPDAAPIEARTPPPDAAPRQVLKLPAMASRRQYRARPMEAAPQVDRTSPPLLESLLEETPAPAPPTRPARERPAPPVRPARPAIPRELLIIATVGLLLLAVLLTGRVLGFSYSLPRAMVLATARLETATPTRTATPLPTATPSHVPPTATPSEPPTAAPTEPPTAAPTEAPPQIAPTGWCADDGVTITCYNGAAPPSVVPFVIPPSPTIAPYQATEQADRCDGRPVDSPCWTIWVLGTPTD